MNAFIGDLLVALKIEEALRRAAAARRPRPAPQLRHDEERSVGEATPLRPPATDHTRLDSADDPRSFSYEGFLSRSNHRRPPSRRYVTRTRGRALRFPRHEG